MKWHCKCGAINPLMSFKCHDCDKSREEGFTVSNTPDNGATMYKMELDYAVARYTDADKLLATANEKLEKAKQCLEKIAAEDMSRDNRHRARQCLDEIK